LVKSGENVFKVFVFDADGGPISLGSDRFVITRTAASIDAIPASHSIGVEAKERIGGSVILKHIVKVGDQLPKKGREVFKAETSLKAQSPESLRIKIWEGEIKNPVTDNRYVGALEIRGKDFDEGVIAAGDELILDYEVLDSGNLVFEVTVPSISGSFHSGRNFYSRIEGLKDLTQASKIIEEEAEGVLRRIEEAAGQVSDSRLDKAREKVEKARAQKDGSDTDSAGVALQSLQEAKKLLSEARQGNLPSIRRLDLQKAVSLFNEHLRELARPTEVTAFDNLVATARKSIENNSSEFESHLDEIHSRNFAIMWRQDWYVIDRFNWLTEDVHLFPNSGEHAQMVAVGRAALKENDIDKLRMVVAQMDSVRIRNGGDEDLMSAANIIVGSR
jgi:molecular chaperone DnaK